MAALAHMIRNVALETLVSEGKKGGDQVQMAWCTRSSVLAAEGRMGIVR
jgi:hypothetical protein